MTKEYKQSAALIRRRAQWGFEEPAFNSLMIKRDIVSAIVGKFPTKCMLEKCFGCQQIIGRKLNIVQFLMLII